MALHWIVISWLKRKGTRLDLLYYNIGNLYMDDFNKYDSAIIYFNKSLVINNSLRKAYSNIGYSYLNLKEWSKAIEYFEKALELDIDSYLDYNNLGFVYMRQGEYNNSMDALTTSLRISESNPWCHRNLGLLHKILDDKNEAKKHYELAIEQVFLKNWDKKFINELKLYCK